MGGKGQIWRNYANKPGRVGKKKTNNNNTINSINATANNADSRTNNAVRLTSRKQWVDADKTKVVADDTINATQMIWTPTQTMLSGWHQENKGLMLMEPKLLRMTPSMLQQRMQIPTPTMLSKLPKQIPMRCQWWTPVHQMSSLKAQTMHTYQKKQMLPHTLTPAQGIKQT